MQLQAGYFIEAVRELATVGTSKIKLDGILENLSYFELDSNTQLNKTSDDALLFVANNYISRGIPTRPNAFIEDFLATTFSKTRKIIDNRQSISYKLIDESIKELLFRTIHIIDPRISTENQKKYWLSTSNEREKNINQFVLSELVVHLNEAYLQLVEQNRNLRSIIDYTSINDDFSFYINNSDYKFISEPIDITIEIPYSLQNKKGLSIRLDSGNIDFIQENKKNEILGQLNWCDEIIFNTNQNIDETIQKIQEFTYCEYFDTISLNYRKPLFKNSDGLDAMQLALTPLGVARIQKTILEFLIAEKLSFDAEEWKIAVIERDIPCAFLAIDDLKQLFRNLFALEGKERRLPRIKLFIFRSEEFASAELNMLYQGTIDSIDNFNKDEVYDLLIDISILQRKNVFSPEIENKAKNFAFIRSCHSIKSTRKFYYGNLIRYAAFDYYNDEEKADIAEEADFALEYFLKNLFRKQSFLENQAAIIKKSLQLSSFAAIMPPASGKTLCYEFAALLQPAISIAVHPVMTLMRDVFDSLRKDYIDSSIYLNSSQRKTVEKLKAQDKLVNGNILLAFISADRIKQIQFREMMSQLYAKEIYFGLLLIDEIHCISEWSHDFRIEYHHLTKNIRSFCKPKDNNPMPVSAYTATASYNVVTDICAELELENQSVYRFTNQLLNLNCKIVNTNNNSLKSGLNVQKAKTIISKNKKEVLKKNLKEIYYQNEEKLLNVSSLLYCPEKKSVFGVKSDANDSITDYINAELPQIKNAIFEGTISDGIDSVSGTEAQNALENYRKFQTGEVELLIAAKTAGIGLNKLNIRNVLFVNYPNSIDSFYQQVHRAGRDYDAAYGTILFDDQTIRVKEEDFIPNENGELLPTTVESDISIDKLINVESIKKTYQGRAKETVVVNEILNQITFPVQKPVDILTEIVEREFGEKITFVTQPASSPYQIHINKGYRTYGFIDYHTNSINTNSSQFDLNLSKRILLFVKLEIANRVQTGTNECKWLESTIEKPASDGVLKVLDKLKISESSKLTVQFNNRFTDNQSRTDVETLLAVYRLSTVGVINDFTMDYSNQEITFYFTKKDDNVYLTNLYNFVSKYIAKEKALNVFEIVPKYHGKSMIEKIMNYLINFVYDFVIQYRMLAINQMEMLCAASKTLNDDKVFSNKLKELFQNYFNAKYLNPLYGPSLLIDSNNLTYFTFKLIENYIKEIGFSIEKWNHLKASTELLLKTKPDNYVLLTLNAFSQFLLEYKNDKAFENAFENMTKGFFAMRISENMEFNEYTTKTDFFLSKLYEQNNDLRAMIEPILYLKTQVTWLSNFNKKFLAGIEKFAQSEN